MRLLAPAVVAALLSACDSGSTPPVGNDAGLDASLDAGVDGSSLTFTLTSPTVTEGGVIPLAHVCARDSGLNQSPALMWANPPVGTKSFAIVFTDKNNSLVHSAIYDIPATLTMIPADVDKVYEPPDVPGAHQPLAYSNIRGYAGPCPDTLHKYEQKIYALATATVPNATMATTRAQLVAALATNLGTATLTASYTPP